MFCYIVFLCGFLVVCLRGCRNSSSVSFGRLSSELGWNMSSIVERLEAKRKAEGAVYADAKKAELAKAKAKAAAIPGDAILAKFGY